MSSEITNPPDLQEQTATYEINFQHSINPTVRVSLTITMGDSGATPEEADQIATALTDVILSDVAVSFSGGSKSFKASRSVLVGTN